MRTNIVCESLVMLLSKECFESSVISLLERS
nr:MAG TPA: hypothetical protein [Caudoviricetes sp.]